jgi:hypothetical protein
MGITAFEGSRFNIGIVATDNCQTILGFQPNQRVGLFQVTYRGGDSRSPVLDCMNPMSFMSVEDREIGRTDSGFDSINKYIT